ncbi:oxidoreductase [Labrys wisconsinensis]|uniref:2,4-dienoyl-CoA reductase-like NADH-dependent reductase (Old Yellow Enzyme family) n=1 Tax=Labrys wisconsinensis TaxID=425677 RepID=A0ABU0JM81_9HYPH|nr:NAD-binding protein [Labrys wisconsinensis]MDQ0475388.1 2,4-dienoyl-CoA reductase-like NADH-dependent reductase (Old Yellow Enzyme family) [Labrys wisconsinensis]
MPLSVPDLEERHGRPPEEPHPALPLMFSPLRIRGLELRNRLVFQPHFTALGGRDGMVSDAHVAYHEERARGGVGLIVFESQAVHPSGKMSRRFVSAWDPATIPRYRRLAEAVHRHGARLIGQLTHGGHTSLENPPHLLWAPTQMPEPSSNFSTKAMDLDDIAATIEGFAVSARNAREGGFDGVEIKVAHDGLLRSFASPFFNHRTDRYGGSFENRVRLSVEVLQAIKAATAADFPVGVRICLHEFTPFGYGLDYGLRLAEALEATGCVDYFNADAGSFSSYWMEIPPAGVAAGTFRELNAALKRQTRLPVVAFGRISPPELGEEMLAAGEADLIGFARQLIADPETPNKLRSGRSHLVRPCIACNDACIYQVGQEKQVRCIHNPAAGREREVSERVLPPVDRARRVVVVGGGPAGMKVAEIARRRGHAVTLLERAGELGGQVRQAARQPEHQAIAGVADYLEAAIRDLGVDIRLRAEGSPAAIAALAPDVLVVATGSEPNLPDSNARPAADVRLARDLGRQVVPAIPGLDLPFVVSGDQVLRGEVQLQGRVLVIDVNGRWEAAGTAEYLADRGCRVEIVTPRHAVGSDLEGGTRTLFYRRAAVKRIAIRPETALVAIEPGRVRVASVFAADATSGWDGYMLHPGAESWIEGLDWVVAVLGRRSREDLYHRCREAPELRGVRIERVGDCVAPRLIESNIAEAHSLATQL